MQNRCKTDAERQKIYKRYAKKAKDSKNINDAIKVKIMQNSA